MSEITKKDIGWEESYSAGYQEYRIHLNIPLSVAKRAGIADIVSQFASADDLFE